MKTTTNIDLIDMALEFISEERKNLFVKQVLADKIWEVVQRKASQGQEPDQVINEVAHKLQSFMENGLALDFSTRLNEMGIEARTRKVGYGRPLQARPEDIAKYAEWIANNQARRSR